MKAALSYSLFGGALLGAATSAVAQSTVQKADTPIFDLLNVGTSWVGGQVPGANHIALFGSAMATAANNMNRIGGDMEVRGIRVGSPAAVNVSNGYSIAASVITSPSFAYAGTLSIGDWGIALSSALAPPEIRNWFFNIGCPIAITADQEWPINVSSGIGRWDLAIGGSTWSSSRRTVPTDLGGHTITKLGAGTLAVLFDRGFSNGTLVVDQGTVEFANAINADSNSNIQLDVDPSLTVQVNSGADLFVSQAPTAGSGGVNWQANTILRGGELHLNGGDYTGDLTIGGVVTIPPGVRGHIDYNNRADTPDPITIMIASTLAGEGHLVLDFDDVANPREQDRILLAGNDATLSGLVTLWFRSRVYVTNTSGSATGTAELKTLNVSVLAGDGTIGPVDAEGTIWPGTVDGDTETLTTAEATLSGTLRIDIDGAASDVLMVNGVLELDGATLELNFPGAGFTEPSYVIAEAISITGTGFATRPAGYTTAVIDGGVGQQLVVSQFDDPFPIWLAGFPGVDPSMAGLLDDADGDGWSNMVEFVLDANPTIATRGAGPVARVTAGELRYEFTRRQDATAAGYLSVVQYSADMVTWADAVASPVASDATTETLAATIPAPARFARLKIMLP